MGLTSCDDTDIATAGDGPKITNVNASCSGYDTNRGVQVDGEVTLVDSKVIGKGCGGILRPGDTGLTWHKR